MYVCRSFAMRHHHPNADGHHATSDIFQNDSLDKKFWRENVFERRSNITNFANAQNFRFIRYNNRTLKQSIKRSLSLSNRESHVEVTVGQLSN
jgi:hypothetical protein